MKKNTLVNILVIIVILAIGVFGSLYLSKQQEKKQVQSGSQQLLTIINSGSTNVAGYTISIHKDGSGLLQYASRPSDQNSNQSKVFLKDTFKLDQLIKTLNEIGDVSKIPSGHCIKSVSFGSRTTIVYNSKTGGDISCMADTASAADQSFQNEISQIQQQALK